GRGDRGAPHRSGARDRGAARVLRGDRGLERGAVRVDRRDRVVRQPARRSGRQAPGGGEDLPAAPGRGGRADPPSGRLGYRVRVLGRFRTLLAERLRVPQVHNAVGSPLVSFAVVLSALSVSHNPAPPGRHRDCGGNTCSVRLDPRLTKTEPVRGPDSGPFTYTVTVINLASTRSTITVTCTALAPQLPCTTPSPSQLTLASGGSGTVTLGYTTLGTGTFRQLIVAENIDQDVNNKDTLVTAVPVAGPSIGTVISPIEGGEIGTGDTVRVSFSHPSGVVQSSFRLFLDGADSSARAGTTASTITITGLGLLADYHTVSAY